ncbi:MAG: endonuclease/exonuclease/phosphatase family protein [Bacteroidales bacterium]|nr:endonuclease/exonuclease/phosphatase family protein [Bacteroidales bacterium]
MKSWFRSFWGLFLKGSAILLIISLLLGLSSPYINPYDFWPVAFFGLAFPVVWILSLGLTVLMIKRKLWFYSMLFFVLVASPMMFNHFSLPLKSNESKSGEYRIVTYNVHNFSGSHYGKSRYSRQNLVFEFIDEIKPSIVCMQEYAVKSKKNGHYQELPLKKLNINYKVYSDDVPDINGTIYSLMIGSQFPVMQNGLIYTPEKEVFGMFADIQFPEGMVRVYNIHLESVKLIGEKKLLRPHRNLGVFKDFLSNLKGMYRKLKHAFSGRAYQAYSVAASIRQSPYPVIVAGDFNDTPASYSYRMIKNGLKDAAIFKGFGFHRTYAESLYPIRIDQVLIDHKLTSGSYSRRKIYLSDHYPVVAGFSFKPSR